MQADEDWQRAYKSDLEASHRRLENIEKLLEAGKVIPDILVRFSPHPFIYVRYNGHQSPTHLQDDAMPPNPEHVPNGKETAIFLKHMAAMMQSMYGDIGGVQPVLNKIVVSRNTLLLSQRSTSHDAGISGSWACRAG